MSPKLSDAVERERTKERSISKGSLLIGEHQVLHTMTSDSDKILCGSAAQTHLNIFNHTQGRQCPQMDSAFFFSASLLRMSICCMPAFLLKCQNPIVHCLSTCTCPTWSIVRDSHLWTGMSQRCTQISSGSICSAFPGPLFMLSNG